MNDRFIRACRRQPVDATPVWFMRQAGRYMPEYRALRERHSLLEICRQPELAVTVTLQPVNAVEVDAAILFSDLLLPFTPMGLDFDFVKGEGPSIARPIRHADAVDRLHEFEPREGLAHVLTTIRLLRGELADRVPLIGFGGAPFTMAAYAIEGGPSTNYAIAKAFMYAQPAAWHRLCDRFARVMAEYMRAQVEAGAEAIQIFDSWVGQLSRADYREFALPHTRTIFEGLAGSGVPTIHFGVNTAAILPDMKEAGGDVIGVDWRAPLDEAWARVGHDRAIQGNLDPVRVLGPLQGMFDATDDILRRAAGRPGHIFNLGHGLLPTTSLEHVQALARHVHAFTPYILVIGGGISGLTAAYELQRRGCTPILLERSRRCGGLILTEQTGGLIIEAGPESVLATKPAALDLARELGLEREIQSVRPPGGAFVLRGRTLYRLPRPSVLGIPQTWRALARYRLLPPLARARLALEPLVRARRDADDESIGAFFRRRFGAATVDLVAQPLLGGIHAGDIETLSMRSLFPRLLELERRHGSILRAPAAASSPGVSPFMSLRGGMGTLVAALQARLDPASTHLETEVLSIERGPAGWRAAGRDAAAVIVAAPAFAAVPLLESIDSGAAALAAQVPYVSTASVTLAWPRASVAHPLAGTGFVVARRHSDVRITACTWVSSKWEGRAPEDTALLRAFVGGSHDPDVVTLGDEAMVALVAADLSAILGISGAPTFARVHRWPRGGAQHLVGHLDRVEAIEQRLAAHPGLFVTGSGFRPVGIPDCIADARRVAALAAAVVRR